MASDLLFANGSTSSSTRVEPYVEMKALEAEDAHTIRAALDKLVELGFTDEALNRDVLAAVGNSTERAIAVLCDTTILT